MISFFEIFTLIIFPNGYFPYMVSVAKNLVLKDYKLMLPFFSSTFYHSVKHRSSTNSHQSFLYFFISYSSLFASLYNLSLSLNLLSVSSCISLYFLCHVGSIYNTPGAPGADSGDFPRWKEVSLWLTLLADFSAWLHISTGRVYFHLSWLNYFSFLFNMFIIGWTFS